ncbi:DUF397 domain-containing protein [Amycolatopsis minnesotensis]|uniref:DUF397 domain-containing protein n=1 Tax=Amycolatopsis minnesotensis TaxID=337894 RepID=A0ABN2RYP1_9PSEU
MAAFEQTWTKSTHSGLEETSDCIEVALAPQLTSVRDSKAPSAGHLTLAASAWRAFLDTARFSDRDLPMP